MIEVWRSTNSTKIPTNPASGNRCETGNGSRNTPKPKHMGNRDVDQLSHVDLVPTNTHSSKGESRLRIFEDSEAMIKKIIEGRSPAMRHVSRTHKVALDWLFYRINLDSKIQIKYVDTKNQLADMLTKGSFTRDEWNHLRFLNVINFSMFSCSHVFLANRKQSAMSKRGQEGTSGEATAMAKPRPLNLVSHNLSSAKKKSQHDLSDSNNPVNAKAEEVSSEATGRHSTRRILELNERLETDARW